MAWQMNDGVRDTYNILALTGSTLVYQLKELLKHVGWTVQMSGDGIAAYSAVGDTITKDTSGANGMDNANAWFRIQDPGTVREYVFQRGANHYTWKVIYSALDKFVGGAPAFGTIPTATDQKGVADGGTAAAPIFSSTVGYVGRIAAQDTPVGDVYAFWMLSTTSGYGTGYCTALFCEPISAASAAAADLDPCVHFADDRLYQGGVQSDGGTAQIPYCWQRMNQANEEWDTVTVPSPFAFIYSVYGSNPHDGSFVPQALVFHRFRAAAALKGFKGMSNFIKWGANLLMPWGAVYSYGGENYTPGGPWLFPGIPAASTKLLV